MSCRGVAGVILNNLSLYGDQEKQQQIARIANFGVWLPLHEIFQKNPTLVFSTDRGDLTLNTSVGDLLLSQLNFHLTSQTDSLAIDRLDARLKNLRLTASGLLRWPEGDKSKSFVVPDLAPLVKAASWLDFPQGTPTLALQIHSNGISPDDVDLRGVLYGTNFHWKQLSLGTAKVQFELEPDSLKIPAMSIDCYGGSLSAGLSINYQKRELLVTKLVSTVEPFRFVSAILKTDSMDTCRSIGQTVMSGENITFDLKKFSGSRGAFRVGSAEGIAFTDGSREITLGDFHSTLKFTDGNLVLDGSEFTIHGGKGRGTFTMPLSAAYQYQLKVEVNGVSLAQLGREIDRKSNLVGVLNASFDGGGAIGMESHYGNGHVSVTDGKFYSIPLLGSLRAMLTGESSQFGVDEARNLNAGFSLRRGLLQSPDFRIESTATMLRAKGQVDIIHKTLDVDVRAQLKGVAGIVTGIVSRIFELHGQGPLDAVRWRFANVPGLVEDAAQVTGEGVKEVTGKTGKVIEGTGKVIEGVGEEVFKLFGDRPRIFPPEEKTPAPEK